MATLTNTQRQQLAREKMGYGNNFGGGEYYNWLESQGRMKEWKDLISQAEQVGFDKFMQPAPTPITQYMSESVQNPELPAQTELQPELQNVQQNELLEPVSIESEQIQQQQPIQAQQASTQGLDVDPDVALGMVDATGASYDPALTQAVTPMQAAQGTVSDLATVKGQLEQLLDFEGDNYPKWAQGAAAAAQDMLAARGLGSSSIGAGAITAAIQKAALPIASQDASTYFQMDMQNLSNEQQTRLNNIKFRQQNMLTDTAARNAAKQFNAASAQETQQFLANLVTEIDTANKNRKLAVEQFNAQQANTMEQFNSQTDMAIAKFNAEMRDRRNVFNATQQAAINQSNVLWRRSINTRNNEQVNAALTSNNQNRFNLSSSALNALWQQFRDEQNYLFTATENQRDRDMQMVHAANNRRHETRNDDNWVRQVGEAVDLLTKFV